MKNFMLKLRAAWDFWRHFPPIVTPRGYWTNTDAHHLSDFLTSDTGSKLRNMWKENVNSSAQNAIVERPNAQYWSGIAWGVRAQTVFTDSLLKLSPVESESPQTEEGGEEPFQTVNK